ncbi:MAG: hypothetical protein KR126chlam6_01518, partial [Candidatus Anoxychlamydiales bacterium]|nr:hypothetical protein [Candidatus Anoxychlamydiales bacterium]
MKKLFFLLSISFALYSYAIDEHPDTHLDANENTLIEIDKSQILDLEKNDILLEILDYPKNVLPGSSYDIKLKLLNNTNASALNDISIDQLKECKYQFSENLPVELKPLEEKLITIKIDTPSDLKEEMINNVQIKNKTLNSDYSDTNLLATTEIKPEVSKPNSDKTPSISTSFGYDINESPDSKLYLESSGTRLLNSKDINLEYALKIPVMVEGTIPKKLDGKPEKFYVGYKTDNYNILLGDTEYKISPLTISPFSDSDDPAPVGRGSLVTINRNKLGAGFLYLNKPPFETSNKSNSFLALLSYKLLNNKFSAAILNTSYKKPLSKNEQIYSVRSTYAENDCLYDLEYANTSLKKDQDAYFFTAKDKLSFLSYDFNGYLAKPKFSGYLSDRSVFNSLAKISISKNLIATGSYMIKNTNLDKSLNLKNAKRDFAALAKITFVAPFKLSSNLVYENIVKKDALVSRKNNKLDKFSLIFSQPINKFTLSSTLAKGKYSAQKESYLKRDYNRVDFKVDYALFKNQK